MIIWHDIVQSTNKIAMEQFHSCQGLCITAKFQTQGKGQQGNIWQSEYGKVPLSSSFQEAGAPSILRKWTMAKEKPCLRGGARRWDEV